MGVLHNFRSFGYEYGIDTELTEVPGIVARAYRTHRSFGRIQKMLYPYPGYCGMERTELTEVPGTGMKVVQKLAEVPGIVARAYGTYQKLRAGIKMLYPYPGYCGTVVQILQKFRVRVWMSYRTHKSSLYGYECCT